MVSPLSRISALLLLLAASHQLGTALLIQLKAQLAPRLVERAWAQSLAQDGRPVKPWPWADTWPMARLEIPALAESQLVLAGDTGNVLAFGPGHQRASAMPGTRGVAVIGGHRDTHFRFLRHIVPGQRIVVQLASGRAIHYRVVATDIVDASKGGIAIDSGDNLLLLVTCYPFDALSSDGPLRYRVIATPEPRQEAFAPSASAGAGRFML
ncbi:class GN sortase [Seongchinamella unica]|nr:class GN sortase [Seongchinamella unica]